MAHRLAQADIQVVRLIQARAGGGSESTASRLLTGSGDTPARIRRGTSLTSRRVEEIMQRASDQWPADLPWPPDIPRPAPSPGSPAAEAADQRAAVPVIPPTAARFLLERERPAVVAAMELGPSGRLRSPSALAEALGIPLTTVRHALARAAAGAPAPKAPGFAEDPSWTWLVWTIAAAAGDERFRRGSAA